MDEVVIGKLLTDPRIQDFSEDPIFLLQVLDSPEAAQVLVRIAALENQDIARRAKEMLSLFGAAALPAVLKGLVLKCPEWRFYLLSVVRTIMSEVEPRERLGFFPEVSSCLRPLLQDRSLIPPPEVEDPVEIEYEYRVCDEAYLLLIYLQDQDREGEEDVLMRGLDEEMRDDRIEMLRRQLGEPLV